MRLSAGLLLRVKMEIGLWVEGVGTLVAWRNNKLRLAAIQSVASSETEHPGLLCVLEDYNSNNAREQCVTIEDFH